MVRPNVKLERYMYSFSDLMITSSKFDGIITIKSDKIRTLTIKNQFDSNVSAGLLISFMCSKDYYETILTNIDTLYVSFDLYKIFVGYVDDDSKNINFDNQSLQKKLCYSLKLKAMNADNLSTYVATVMKNDGLSEIDNDPASDELVTMSNDGKQDLILTSFYLYDDSNISKYKMNKSYIIKGGLNDALYVMLNDRGFSNILMDSTNDTSLNTYAIPYGHLGHNLEKLNEYYGIYNSPYLFFMGIDKIYLLNKENIGNCLTENELGSVNIYLENSRLLGSINSGCYIDMDNKIYILNTQGFDINDNDSEIDYAIGGIINTVVRGTGEVYKDKIGDYDVERSYVVQNPKQHKQLIYNIKESKRSINLVFENVDITIFTPNKKYSLITDETFYNKNYNINGSYRLNSSNILFTKDGEEHFKASIQTTLKKI